MGDPYNPQPPKPPVLAIAILVILLTAVAAMAVNIALRGKGKGNGGNNERKEEEENYRKNTTFHGVKCTDTWTGDRLREEFGDPKDTSDWNFDRTKDGISKAYDLSKRFQSAGCQGIYVPKNSESGKPSYVFDTSKCEDDILYEEDKASDEYKEFFGTLYFHLQDSCPEGYTDPGNACRTKVVSECETNVCDRDEICAMQSGVPTCFPRDVYDIAKRGMEEPVVSQAELKEKTQDEILNLIASRLELDKELLTRTNNGNPNSETKERIFCYNGGKPVSVTQPDGRTHRYCLCNEGEHYENGAAWGGTRCNVKCPVWIDKQRERLDQIADGGDVTVPQAGNSLGAEYGYMLHPKATDVAGGEAENAAYREFFAEKRKVSDPTIQICGNETRREDGKLIRRGTCIKMHPLSTSRLDSVCACVGRFNNPDKGCRVDFCPPDSICDINNKNAPAGSCAWRPDEKGLINRWLGGTPNANLDNKYPNEHEDSMYGCSCGLTSFPSKRYELDSNGEPPMAIYKRLYSYDTPYSLEHHDGNMPPTARRMCQDPCDLRGCGWDQNSQVDPGAVCGIEYDDDKGQWKKGSGTGTNHSFCLCSASHKGANCTEENTCDLYEGSPCGEGLSTPAGRCIKGHMLEIGADGKAKAGDFFTPHPNDTLSDKDYPKTAANAARCKCNQGHAGKNCGITSVEQCHSNGAVNQDATCRCCPGSKGKRCQFTDYWDCNGEGQVEAVEDDSGEEYFRCHCNAGYAGQRCEFSDEHTCSNRGKVDSQGQCTCENGWQGKGCANPPDCPFQPCHSASVTRGMHDWKCQLEPSSAYEKSIEKKSYWHRDRNIKRWEHWVKNKGDARKGTSNVCRGGYGSKNENYYFMMVGDKYPCGGGSNNNKGSDPRNRHGFFCGANMVYKTRDESFYADKNWSKMTHMEVEMDHGCKEKIGGSRSDEIDRYDHPDNKSRSGNCKADLIVWRTDRWADRKHKPHAKSGDPNEKLGAYLGDGCSCPTQDFYIKEDKMNKPYGTMTGSGTREIRVQASENESPETKSFDPITDGDTGKGRRPNLPQDDTRRSDASGTSEKGEDFETC